MYMVSWVSALLFRVEYNWGLEFPYIRAVLSIMVSLDPLIHHYIVLSSGVVAPYLRCHSFPILHIHRAAFSSCFLVCGAFLFRSLLGRSYVVDIPDPLDILGTFLRAGREVSPHLEMRSSSHVRRIGCSPFDTYHLPMAVSSILAVIRFDFGGRG